MKNIHVLNQQIYITTDEEIKEGDWFYVKTPNIQGGNVVLKSLGFGKNCWSENILTETADEKGYDPTHCVRIILTTDQDLIKDGVQAIDDEFLEWFVKNPSCESVVVNFNYKKFRWSELNKSQCYKIIIPQEEPKPIHEQIIDAVGGEDRFREIAGLKPKQETLEEVAERLCPNSSWRLGFIEGAKWQQERMYSEEEVLELVLSRPGPYLTDEEIKQWFEQFKKK
jgi:hypothetical protein